MQVLTKEGATVVLSAVDADGLDIKPPLPAEWGIASPDFTVTVADDTLSATIQPNGLTATGTLVVTAGALTVTADVSYTNDTPPDRVAAKLNLTFTTIAPPTVAPPTPAPVAPT